MIEKIAERKLLDRFPRDTKIFIDVVFRGEYRIGWKYDGKQYTPGSGSYYNFQDAVEIAWEVFLQEFPYIRHLTFNAVDSPLLCKCLGDADENGICQQCNAPKPANH